MIDRNCVIKPEMTLEQNTIVSALTITTNEKGIVSFTPLPVQESDLFLHGAICYLPLEMQLKPYQFMGQPSPYKQGCFEDGESDLEESDDEII